ncbi:MAG: DUF4118 domain-containing protein [Bacteroidota bacterium]
MSKQKTSAVSPSREYFVAALAIMLAGLLCFPLTSTIGYQTVGLIFLIMVASLSLFLGRGPVLLAAILNFAIWNYFFIPPLFTFHVYSLHDAITLFANFLIAIVGGTLIHRIRKNQLELKRSREDISVLYSLLEALNNTTSIKDVVKKAREEIQKQFQIDIIIYLKVKEGSGLASRPFGNTDFSNEEEFSIASRCFEEGIPAGNYTDMKVSEGLQYLPLIVPRGIIGVVGFQFEEAESSGKEHFNLLNSFINQIALSLEREMNIDLVKANMILLESEKLFQTILNSVSHELRTPIAIITTAVSNLDDENTSTNPAIRKQICEELNIASMRLNLLVENILDMSRIESGLLKLNLQYTDVGDLFGIALNELKTDLARHVIKVHVAEELPLILLDVNLMKQCVINILHNAAIYTPEGSEIILNAWRNEEKEVVVEIKDSGSGVPGEALNKLFN